jgi:hypothetical protein
MYLARYHDVTISTSGVVAIPSCTAISHGTAVRQVRMERWQARRRAGYLPRRLRGDSEA